jgi:hypothetical protein
MFEESTGGNQMNSWKAGSFPDARESDPWMPMSI